VYHLGVTRAIGLGVEQWFAQPSLSGQGPESRHFRESGPPMADQQRMDTGAGEARRAEEDELLQIISSQHYNNTIHMVISSCPAVGQGQKSRHFRIGPPMRTSSAWTHGAGEAKTRRGG